MPFVGAPESLAQGQTQATDLPPSQLSVQYHPLTQSSANLLRASPTSFNIAIWLAADDDLLMMQRTMHQSPSGFPC